LHLRRKKENGQSVVLEEKSITEHGDEKDD
jgi:hypothetical protein